MNPKLQKTNELIDKHNGKIAALQSRLKALENKKTQLENAEIIQAVRSGKISLDEISQIFAGGGAGKPLPASLPGLNLGAFGDGPYDDMGEGKDGDGADS